MVPQVVNMIVAVVGIGVVAVVIQTVVVRWHVAIV